jgi:hypothetical protein
MGTWNALYFRGDVPTGFRPEVEGSCALQRLAEWSELALPGVADGESSACLLSKSVSGPVIWVIVQTTASVVAVAHFEAGECRRRVEFADGSWRRVEGTPQPWEMRLFSPEELEAAKDVGDPGDDAELEAVFASKTLEEGKSLPWPREWETLRYALDVTSADWEAARQKPAVIRIPGRATSNLTYAARLTLIAGVGCLLGFGLTRNAGFGGIGAALLLVALGAGFLRRIQVGRWFL